VHLPVAGFGNTLRKDAWWAGPLATFTVLASFIVYATFRAFENKYYTYTAGGADYLSPMYSPLIPTAGLGIPLLTPAMLILPFPASFRLTCYYYRKAYYRAFGMDPPACAVGEPRGHSYRGETRLWVFNNLHRFTLYAALVFLVFLWHDFFKAIWFDGKLGFGMGSLVLFINPLLLSLYTLSCHAFRHLVGGNVNSYSTAPLGQLRHAFWKKVTVINERHALFAWLSLFGVALTDFYIRQVSSGAIADIRFF
jgi:hypothetical protein